jgi:hypothetical protein
MAYARSLLNSADRVTRDSPGAVGCVFVLTARP